MCLALFLTSCASERIVEKPVITEVVRVEYRPLPAELLMEHGKSTIPGELTFGDALKLWGYDRAAIDALNAQIASIRDVQNGSTE